MPEKAVQQQIVNLLRSVGGQVWVLGTRRPRGDYHGTCQTPGIPDLYCFIPVTPNSMDYWSTVSCAVWVEVKAAGGRLSPEQAVFRKLCLTRGIAHIVGGLGEVEKWLTESGLVR